MQLFSAFNFEFYSSLFWYSAPFLQHTEVKTWDKVNSGLLKMYRVEVLGKHAVVQHFIYSSFLPAAPAAVPAPHIDVPVVRTCTLAKHNVSIIQCACRSLLFFVSQIATRRHASARESSSPVPQCFDSV
jgi:hypothetical protein